MSRNRSGRPRALGMIGIAVATGFMAFVTPAPASMVKTEAPDMSLVASTRPAMTAGQVHAALNPAPRMHALPPPATASKIAASSAVGPIENLAYHGGPVMQTSNNSVPIFWMPNALQDGFPAIPSPQYMTVIQQYFADIGGKGLYGLNTQYYQTLNGPVEFIVNSSGLVQAVLDTTPYPAADAACAGNGVDCLSDAQLQAEIASVIAAQGLPKDLKTMYYVYTAPHESSCYSPTFCFKSDLEPNTNFKYCAYHFAFDVGGQAVIYANMPYGWFATNNVHCTTATLFPNDREADVVVSTTSHEQMEATTDPLPLTGWADSVGMENGDKCAYNYGPLTLDGGLANQSWNGHFYLVQQEWDNSLTACAQSGPAFPPLNGQLAILTASLPSATERFPYSTLLVATGGSAPYRWTKVPHTRLPKGLHLKGSTGVLAGTPRLAGTYTIQLRVMDKATPKHTVIKNLTLFVA